MEQLSSGAAVTRRKRILVVGSCVTRDALNAERCEWDIADYVARTSFASQIGKPVVDRAFLGKIASPFQKKMVRRDMEKSLYELVSTLEFDLLVLDIIDDRFALIEHSRGLWVTASSEYRRAAQGMAAGKRIPNGAAQFETQWKLGFKKFLDVLRDIGSLHKLRVNRVFWANRVNDGAEFPGVTSEMIEQANIRLARCYGHMDQVLPPSAFFKYEADRFVADASHRWGIAPFHYGPEFYVDTLAHLTAASVAMDARAADWPDECEPVTLRASDDSCNLVASWREENLPAETSIMFRLWAGGICVVKTEFSQMRQKALEYSLQRGAYTADAVLRHVSGREIQIPISKPFAVTDTLRLVNSGHRLVSAGYFKVPGFAEIHLSRPIDWSQDPFQDRGWVWIFLQLEMLRSLLALDRATRSVKGMALAIDVIRSWANALLGKTGDAAAWHDHGSALRANHLVAVLNQWRDLPENLKCSLNGAGTTSFETEIIGILRVHAETLARDDFYSKGTNHGFDQSKTLLVLSDTLRNEPSAALYQRLAVERIRYEATKAFADDGGHVENSPAYLNYGVKQLIDALALEKRYLTAGTLGISDRFIDRAVVALTHMVRPDGLLPLIGDTTEFKVTDVIAPLAGRLPSYRGFLYAISKGRSGRQPNSLDLMLPESGYAVFRDAWSSESRAWDDALHLVFKAGFLSGYHRQDDDLHFVLMAHGIEWLTDGGLYKHQNLDPQRKHCRSALAHNLTMPYMAKASRVIGDVQSRFVDYGVDISTSHVTAETQMFTGFLSRRSLVYDRSRFQIKLSDFITPISDPARLGTMQRLHSGQPSYVTRFLVPSSVSVKQNHQGFDLVAGGRRLRIRSVAEGGFRLVMKDAGRAGVPESWVSPRMNVLKPVQVLIFEYRQVELDASYVLEFI